MYAKSFNLAVILWQRHKKWILLFFVLLCLFGLYKRGANSGPKGFRAVVESKLNKIDGSHPGIEAAIKQRMHDPGSYDHEKTTYFMPTDTTTKTAVYTLYFRGKNAFGAIISQSAVAECNIYTGEVVRFIRMPE